MRHLRLAVLLFVALVTSWPDVSAQSNGVAAKRPVFGGACPACPWGAMGDVVKEAMKPYGYDVQICYYCAGGPRAARLLADGSDATPPQNVTATTLPTPQGKLEFGATSVELLQYAYLGIHDFAKDKEGPRKHLRLLANIQTPNYLMMVAAKAMALTTMDLFTEPSHIQKARAEFESKRGPGFAYKTRLADRKPALDYRK